MSTPKKVFFAFVVVQVVFCGVAVAKYVHFVPSNSIVSRSGTGSLVEKYGYRGINLVVPETTTEDNRVISSTSATSTSTTGMPAIFKFNNASVTEGRGKHPYKFGKKKKKALKHLYPVIVGLLTAKSIIIPLILKTIIMLSKSAFVLSGLSFLASIVMGIKILLLHSLHSKSGSESTKVEVVHVPLQHKYGHYSSSGWIDRESELNKYIPISPSYETYEAYNDDKPSSSSYSF
ncbi:hypothetical protein DMENIID0001_018890 [Sergentomyia squamirostris]